MAVSQHHEKWGGNGYLNKLKEYEISLIGRICAIADNIDALFSDRPYKKAWSKDEVYEYIQENSGIFFDPEIVNISNKCWSEILKLYAK